MNINESINKILKNMMQEYSLKISEECDIKQEKLHDIWNNLCNDFKLDTKYNTTKKSPQKKKTVLVNTCKAILQRGKRAGEECGKKCENKFCRSHAKNIIEEIPEQQKVEDKIPEKIIIRKNRQHDKFWHPRTRFIFKSSKELVVIGKLTDTETFIDLEESDIEICQKWKFKYQLKEGLKS